ncbi:pseudouridine synthase [Enterococcus sp. HY326]|uniref:pseudouridine synthase n=1 Tax=Enterococcus sp. HY326 TaxID=2971265 RepID=UPI00223FFE60|nr:pseudouridine synthase [Enterococcus sp. HY326]
MRLDKFLAAANFGSRKEVKQLIKQKQVAVDGKIVISDKQQVSEDNQITVAGEPVHYQEYYYYLLNKPAGVISATEDPVHKTVLDLLGSQRRKDLFPVGRLDKDTEGLLLITNDGQLSHELLSPKKHVEKEYFAKVAGQMTATDIASFQAGITLKNEGQLQPADLKILAVNQEADTSEISLVIHEGKFHQVKRMVHAVGKEVTYLQRTRMGSLVLDPSLALGEFRELTDKELAELQNFTKGSN